MRNKLILQLKITSLLVLFSISSLRAQQATPKSLTLSELIFGKESTRTAIDEIHADNQIISGKIKYLAGKSITFKSGFYVSKGTDFLGKIEAGNSARISADLTETISTGEQLDLSLLAYPNPFLQFVQLEYFLPSASSIDLLVYDIGGAEVSKLILNRQQQQGKYNVSFNSKGLSSGVYFCVLKSGNQKKVVKVIKQ